MLLSLFSPIPKTNHLWQVSCPLQPWVICRGLPRTVVDWPHFICSSQGHFHLSLLSQGFRLWPSQVRLFAGITYPPQLMFFPSQPCILSSLNGTMLAGLWAGRGPQQQSQVHACGPWKRKLPVSASLVDLIRDDSLPSQPFKVLLSLLDLLGPDPRKAIPAGIMIRDLIMHHISKTIPCSLRRKSFIYY